MTKRFSPAELGLIELVIEMHPDFAWMKAFGPVRNPPLRRASLLARMKRAVKARALWLAARRSP